VLHRLIRDADGTVGQQHLDITQWQGEAGAEPPRTLDDLGRKAMALVGDRDYRQTGAPSHRLGDALHVAMLFEEFARNWPFDKRLLRNFCY